jgi:hypothetical protein
LTSWSRLKFSPTLIKLAHNTTLKCSFAILVGYYPKIESGYSLSDILEDQVADKYFLSEKTIAGLMKGQSTPKTLTYLYALVPGDRFYFKSDNSKHVWQITNAAILQRDVKMKGGKKVVVKEVQVKDDAGQKRWARCSTEVFFLRHAETAAP